MSLSADETRRAISRKLSSLSDESVRSVIGATYSTSTAIVYALSMCLGMGTLTLPYAFAQSGILLGSFFLALCAILAYVSGTFVVETLALGSAMLFEDVEASVEDVEKLLISDAPFPQCDSAELRKDLLKHECRRQRPDKVFKIRERLELGEMGVRMLPTPLHHLAYLCVFLHTTGTLCVYAVTLTTSVEAMLPFETLGDISKHEVVIVAFFACILPLCFADMQKLKSVQSIVMTIRAIAIIMMISGAIYIWLNQDEQDREKREMPLVKLDGVPSLYANAVLAFMMHHSLPGIMAPLEKQADAKKVISRSYIISYIILVVIALTALLAFGTDIPSLYNLAFKGLPPLISKSLDAYPITILSVYPIVGITLRNNLLIFFGFAPPDPKGKKQVKDYIGTLVVTLFPTLVAYLTHDVQAIVSFFAGYFGLSLMLVIPTLLIIWARRTLQEHPDEEFSLKSEFGNPVVYSIICIAWVAAIIFNTYRLFFM